MFTENYILKFVWITLHHNVINKSMITVTELVSVCLLMTLGLWLIDVSVGLVRSFRQQHVTNGMSV